MPTKNKTQARKSPKSRTDPAVALRRHGSAPSEPWNIPAREMREDEIITKDDFWTRKTGESYPAYSAIGKRVADARSGYTKDTKFWTRRDSQQNT